MNLSTLTRYVLLVISRALLLGMMTILPGKASAQVTFTESESTWLNNVNYDGRSASLADIDNDGDLDLLFQGGVPGGTIQPAQQLFRNNLINAGGVASHTFTNITSASLASGLGPSWSAAWGDYDGDGKVDVFVGQSNVAASAAGDVLHNNMPSAFTNTSVATGLNDPGFHQNVGWCDIDNDGRLDMMIGMEGPEPNEIYLQKTPGQFTAVGAAVGFQTAPSTKAYGMAIGDYDGDGDYDVYISTCQGGGNIAKHFFKNMLKESGSLNFVDMAAANGTQFTTNSYGSEFVDFNNDGKLDLFVAGADGEASKIFKNNGDGTFTNVDSITGHPLLNNTGGDLNGAVAVDYDNDGDLDLYFHDDTPENGKDDARLLYRNDGNWQFTDVTASVGLLTPNRGGYDGVWGDIDNDGDVDLIDPNSTSFNERVYISNASTNGNHWLYVRLKGLSGDTTGIGSALFATMNTGTPEEVTLRREANTNPDTFNQSDLPVQFGLGAATQVDELKIQWPDGTVQILHNLPDDHDLTVHFPGDFNGDFQVDASDLAQWETDFGVNKGSDSDLDGNSDGWDFLQWQQQLGKGVRSVVPASGAVPEPVAAALGFAGASIVVLRRARMRDMVSSA